MHIHEDTVVLMAKERMEDALRSADRMRALRLARGPRRSTRVRLGMALVRLGHRILGGSSSSPGSPIISGRRNPDPSNGERNGGRY
jgi:hypothetical protein